MESGEKVTESVEMMSANRTDVSSVKSLMDELSLAKGVVGSGIISKDGRPVEVRLPGVVCPNTIAIMTATIFGAAGVIHTTAGKGTPGRITIRTEDGESHIFSIGRRTLVFLMTHRGFDLSSITPTIIALVNEFN